MICFPYCVKINWSKLIRDERADDRVGWMLTVRLCLSLFWNRGGCLF